MAALFEVDDPDELHTLLVALSEAKFCPLPDRRPMLDNRAVARLCERAVEAYVATKGEGRLAGIPEHMRAYYGSRPPLHILHVIRGKLAEVRRFPMWLESSSQVRANYVRQLISPFAAPDELVAELLADGSEEEILGISNAAELDSYLKKELSYCGCAGATQARELLRDVLRIIRESNELGKAGPSEAWRQAYHRLMAKLHFDLAPGLATWFLYMLDGRGIIEHGFNVTQCSITPKGLRLLGALERYFEPSEE